MTNGNSCDKQRSVARKDPKGLVPGEMFMGHLWMVCSLTFFALLQADRAAAQPIAVTASQTTPTPFERGRTYLYLGEYQQARSVAEDALRADPANPQLYELLGAAYGAQGDLDNAIQAFTDAIRHGSHDFMVYYNRAYAYGFKHEWARAVADYTEALRLQPNHAFAHLNRALAYNGLGERRRSREDLEAVEHSGSNCAETQEALGAAYTLLGETDRALQCYSEAIRQGRHVASLYNNRGGLYAARKDWTHAITDYSEAIKLDPGKPECYYNRARAYCSQRRYAEARADFECARERGGESLSAYALARILATCPDAAVRDGRRAVKYARAACERTGFKDPVLLDLLASAHAEAGQWAEAVRFAEQALELAPEQYEEGVRMRLELYRLHEPYRQLPPERPPGQRLSSAVEALLYGVARGESGDNDEAVSDLRSAVGLNPRLVAAHYALGVALTRQGNFAEGGCEFGRCLELEPKHPMALVCRAETYLVIGKEQEALNDAAEVLVLNPRHFRARCAQVWALANLGKFEQAYRELDELAREVPGTPGLHFLRGHCYSLQGRYGNAITELTEAIRGQPSYAVAYSDRAVALTALGRLNEGTHDLEECVRLAPSLRARTEARMEAVRDRKKLGWQT